MRGRLRTITGHHRTRLSAGWEIASARPGETDPAVASTALDWRSIESLGPVAAALRAANEWSLESPARRFDAEEWWYRLRFDLPADHSGARDRSRHVLVLEGLATIAQGWLNGQACLTSDNMFVSHEIDLSSARAQGNELLLRFSALDEALQARRPRPRWRTPMVENQQLRWFRTTLLGRTPGWSPPAAVLGPWKPVELETRAGLEILDLSLEPGVDQDAGVLDVRCRIEPIDDVAIESARLVVARGGLEWAAPLTRRAQMHHAHLEIPHVTRWWPHTHGEPALYTVRLEILTRFGTQVAELGEVGFRTISLRDRDRFELLINDVPVFCRGACWTPLDCVTLNADAASLDRAIEQVRDAGMNMLRLSGAMSYESEAFLDACDRNGILLWHDFMFANMDYPLEDAAFDASVEREVVEVLGRLSGRPSLAILCGNSEGEQQAAMWGAPRERWDHPLFTTTLPRLIGQHAPNTLYWPSSAHGGAFPHQGNVGTTSYYGVGAYRLTPADARRSDVRFATECLGFANVPEEETIATMPGGLGIKVHHPAWKARSPRDLGAGWDFDDIRDHYLQTLLGESPLDLRYADHDRYLELSRIASGEAMAAAFREWRRAGSACHGALIWFLRDFWPGAGWGVIDSRGVAKAAYHLIQPRLQPRTVLLTDEGGNGVFAHLLNESAAPLNGTLEVSFFRAGETLVGTGRETIRVEPHQKLERPLVALLDGFRDLNHAYRFGPPVCDVIVASVLDEAGAVIARDFHFPRGLGFQVEPDVGLNATVQPLEAGVTALTLSSRRLARYVTVLAPGFVSDQQYFHLAPAGEQRILLRSRAGLPLKGQVRALNSATLHKISIP